MAVRTVIGGGALAALEVSLVCILQDVGAEGGGEVAYALHAKG